MADFHAADLWVAVVPDVSKVGPEMEKAGKEAKGKFGDAVRDFGKSIHDDLEKVGEKAKDVFSKAGTDAGTGFRSTIANEFKDAVSDITGALRSGNIDGAIDGVKTKMGSISDAVKNIGLDVSGWVPELDKSKTPLDEVDKKMSDSLKSVTDISSQFEGLPGKIGAAAGKVTLLAGEIGLAVAAMQQLEPYVDALDQKIHDSSEFGKWMEEHPPSTWGQWLGDHLGAKQSREFLGRTFGYDPTLGHGNSGPAQTFTGGGIEPFAPGFIGPIPPGAVRAPGGVNPAVPAPSAPPGASNFYRDWYGAGGGGDDSGPSPSASAPSSGGGGGRAGGSSYTRPSIGTPTDAAGLAAAGSRVANLYAFAKSLAGTPYSTPLRNDCSGMVAELAAVAVGLPPPAAGARFSTANEGEWLAAHGFQPGLGGPNDLNIGWHQGGPGGGHTAATLPGGIHAEQGGGTAGDQFTLGAGAAGAESSQFDQHAHLAMNGMGGGAQIPTGAEHDPIYTMQAAQGAGGGGGSPAEQQGQQLGQGLGKGFLQLLGLDGSVFGGKSPLDWGAVKLGMGALNWGLGQAKAAGGGGPMGAPMAAMGGGGGGALGALTGLIPSPGPGISAAAVPGGSQSVARATGAGNTNYHVDNSVTVSGNTTSNVTGWMQAAQEAANKNVYPRVVGLSSGLPA